MKELIERLCPWLHRSRVSETSDEDPRQKSGGNNPKDAPATMPKGEKPDDEPRDSDETEYIKAPTDSNPNRGDDESKQKSSGQTGEAERHTLHITGAADDWLKVEKNGEHVGYVTRMKIAGCGVELDYVSNGMAVECTQWGIEQDSYPILLIEAADWYGRPEGER